jgi:hypothetical protein
VKVRIIKELFTLFFIKKESPMKTIKYTEKDCLVYWDSGNNWIYVDWRNRAKVETVKNGCEEILKLLKEKSCSKVLNDNSNVTGSWSAAAEWVAEDWFPRMISAGLKKFAWVQSPHSTLSKMNAKQSVKNDDNGIIKMYDVGDPSAIDWLKS